MSEEDVAAVREIIDASQLRSIDFYEVSARRYEDDVPEPSGEGALSIQTQYRASGDGFGLRMRASITFPYGEVETSVAGEYDMDETLKPEDRALKLFINEVAVMTVYPYLRESVASITAKVFGQPLHIPLVERGELGIDIDEEG